MPLGGTVLKADLKGPPLEASLLVVRYANSDVDDLVRDHLALVDLQPRSEGTQVLVDLHVRVVID